MRLDTVMVIGGLCQPLMYERFLPASFGAITAHSRHGHEIEASVGSEQQ